MQIRFLHVKNFVAQSNMGLVAFFRVLIPQPQTHELFFSFPTPLVLVCVPRGGGVAADGRWCPAESRIRERRRQRRRESSGDTGVPTAPRSLAASTTVRRHPDSTSTPYICHHELVKVTSFSLQPSSPQSNRSEIPRKLPHQSEI
jgi:hypothetical protein